MYLYGFARFISYQILIGIRNTISNILDMQFKLRFQSKKKNFRTSFVFLRYTSISNFSNTAPEEIASAHIISQWSRESVESPQQFCIERMLTQMAICVSVRACVGHSERIIPINKHLTWSHSKWSSAQRTIFALSRRIVLCHRAARCWYFRSISFSLSLRSVAEWIHLNLFCAVAFSFVFVGRRSCCCDRLGKAIAILRAHIYTTHTYMSILIEAKTSAEKKTGTLIFGSTKIAQIQSRIFENFHHSKRTCEDCADTVERLFICSVDHWRLWRFLR